MLDKKACQYCFQKHEKIWDEQTWNEGYIECPKNLIQISNKGKPIPKECDPMPEVKMLKALFCIRKITEPNPDWCDVDALLRKPD